MSQNKNVCSGKTEVYSRVVGFFRPVSQWNDGKQQEFKERKTFNVEELVNREGNNTENKWDK